MSAGTLLIDGYNLMHAAGMAQRDYKPGELLQCRMKLLRLLLNGLSATEIRATTIVFDARDPPPDRPSQVVVSGLKVLFANPGGDADVVIQQWLSRHASGRRVTLVSSDRVLQRAARSCRSKFVGSDEFLRELARRRTSRGHTGSTPADSPLASRSDDSKPAFNQSVSETAYWLKIFGDMPVIAPDDDVEHRRTAPPKPEPAAHSKNCAKNVGRAMNRSGKLPACPEPTNDSKPDEKVAMDESLYWLQVFGGLATESTAASSGELRLEDLETWLKEFQASDEP
jgi:predicted RNA-binding protein with PIN domain